MTSRVLFDGRGLLGHSTGMGRYATELSRAASKATTVSFSALCLPDDPFSTNLNVTLARARPRLPVMHPWQHVGVPIDIWRARASIYHYPSIDVPLVGRGAVIATCPDLTPLRVPRLFSAKVVLYYRAFARRLRRCDIVIAISATTAADVADIVGVSPDRIRIVPLGIGRVFDPSRGDAGRVSAVRTRYGLPERYFLYVGNTMPHKNVGGIVRAFAGLPIQGDAPQLVVAGRPDRYRAPLIKLTHTLGICDRVQFVDYVDEPDLPVLYRSSIALVFPSFYEGFGLPVLEAMASGTPVVTSDAGSLAEITAGSALHVNPADTAALTDAMAIVDRDQQLAAQLRSAGIAKAATYSWESFARAHLKLYEELS